MLACQTQMTFRLLRGVPGTPEPEDEDKEDEEEYLNLKEWILMATFVGCGLGEAIPVEVFQLAPPSWDTVSALTQTEKIVVRSYALIGISEYIAGDPPSSLTPGLRDFGPFDDASNSKESSMTWPESVQLFILSKHPQAFIIFERIDKDSKGIPSVHQDQDILMKMPQVGQAGYPATHDLALLSVLRKLESPASFASVQFEKETQNVGPGLNVGLTDDEHCRWTLRK